MITFLKKNILFGQKFKPIFLLLKLNQMFASTKWQFFVFKHKMAAVALSLHKTWLHGMMQRTTGRGCERWRTDEREKKKKKTGLPSFILLCNFTRYLLL